MNKLIRLRHAEFISASLQYSKTILKSKEILNQVQDDVVFIFLRRFY